MPPTLFPPKYVPPAKFLTVAQPLAAYLSANPCQCCPDVPPEKCPVHAYNTGQHYPSEPTCPINQPSWALADPFTRAGCACPPKLPAEVAAMVASVGQPVSLGLVAATRRHFPWILPILALVGAALLAHHCGLPVP